MLDVVPLLGVLREQKVDILTMPEFNQNSVFGPVLVATNHAIPPLTLLQWILVETSPCLAPNDRVATVPRWATLADVPDTEGTLHIALVIELERPLVRVVGGVEPLLLLVPLGCECQGRVQFVELVLQCLELWHYL